ncbi:hypothetical protein Raf01_76020 [Rugosimonospora africana]|uniref:Uncharacterized protein n=1 Tax=Rugosimonospora africana TaxID=556532 RepID=A0A8J3R130_9ACTN|nr:hypothetical protein Raf01_76020 [Rugosimonospora africana]
MPRPGDKLAAAVGEPDRRGIGSRRCLRRDPQSPAAKNVLRPATACRSQQPGDGMHEREMKMAGPIRYLRGDAPVVGVAGALTAAMPTSAPAASAYANTAAPER